MRRLFLVFVDGLGLNLGRVAGFDIRVHRSMMIFVPLAVLVGGTELVLWLCLVFPCVLVHEIAHGVVARRRSITVNEIVLTPIGGFADIDFDSRRHRDELAVAVAGPVASLGLAVCFAVVAVVAGAGLWPPKMTGGATLPRLAWLNLVLAGFNLVPALPMDGGRIARSLLVRRIGYDEATRQASAAGRWILGGIAVLGAFVNLSLSVVALFLWFVNRAEERWILTPERNPMALQQSWLVQRLTRPMPGFGINPFAFGGGHRNGGLTDKEVRVYTAAFSFDYMGAAEYEFGEVPKALRRIQEGSDRYTATSTKVPLEPGGEGTVFVIAPSEHLEEVVSRITQWAKGREDLRDRTLLATALTDPEATRVGWLELDNSFLFFVDEQMWRAAADVFGIALEPAPS